MGKRYRRALHRVYVADYDELVFKLLIADRSGCTTVSRSGEARNRFPGVQRVALMER